MIDLRSDTVTKPTPEMRRAMAEAEVGDDVYGEDPTLNRLQDRAAEILGKEAALFVPSGTMANEIAIKVWTKPGDAILADSESHIIHYELGGPAALSGVMVEAIPTANGQYDADTLRSMIRTEDDHTPGTRLICLENAHNRCGGTVWPLESLRNVRQTAKGIPVHMDGARVFNAAVALGVPARQIAAQVDSLMFCLSKGLGCPVGSLLVGPQDFIDRAHRVRKLFGGGMRQAGILAAPGLIALDNMIDRLAEDHVRARRLAEGIANAPGFRVDLSSVQTNLVYVETERPALDIERALGDLGILCLALDACRLRLVTHFDVGDEDIDKAVAGFERLAGR